MAISDVQENPPSTNQRPWLWQKGRSGNPAGRPRVVRSIQQLARANTERAFKTVIRCMRCGIPSTELAAAQEVLNRGWGKAPIKIDMEIQSFESFSPEARAAIDLICQLLASQADRQEAQTIEAKPLLIEADDTKD